MPSACRVCRVDAVAGFLSWGFSSVRVGHQPLGNARASGDDSYLRS
jgi:hypothetical protein